MFPLSAGEFLYPVGADSQHSMLYLIYQKTPDHLELWGWDYKTGYAYQMLLSRFTPAGVRMLPSGSGFSFIDKGILKVKQFFKRSARAIEFDAPLYNVEVVHWIDDTLCYTSGKYQEHFGIFQINDYGELFPLCVADDLDCMYPQKIENDLFYIERDAQWHCRVVKTKYILPPESGTFAEKFTWYQINHKPSEIIIDFNENQIVFLNMISGQEGFVIEHSPVISSRDTTVAFAYHHIYKQDDIWRSENIFTFCVPSDFLFLGKQTRLYEALLPLLPYHHEDLIFYSDSVGQDLGIFVYDINTKTKKILIQKPNQSLLGLFLIQNKIFCGGQMVPGGAIQMGANDVGVRVELENHEVR